MEDVLVPLVFFGSIAAIIISLSYYKNRRLERTALIAAGKEASIFEYGKPKHYLSLKYGMLLVGIAVGIIVGNVVSVSTEMPEEMAFLSMMLLFGGASLVLFYIIQKTMLKDE
ncbi:hypothetical protein KEM09_21400 [Carboxylicivirga mesophila]|uniref:DUF6249 domain-containing protein n=2 Tax=Carboxylicivirga TaxID=1628153 RepID=A0A941IXZ7_9BACT|nr:MULTISPECIES: DUF6249 domain-containing protein [Carboxylicivirga]MBR8536038.1 hypothetical protein [Carboxylicivirga sediminis]MBS2213979.1 hypothetical protein [Carboxylicivirga mesophila]